MLRTVDAVRELGRSHVRWAVRSGRWQQPHLRVVVRHNGPLTRHEQLAVAALAGPTGTMLAGLSSLELHGFTGFADPDVHVVIPHHARPPSMTGVIAHRSVVREHLTPLVDPPRTAVERSVLDAALWAGPPRLARSIVLASVQQRLTTPQRLAATAQVRGRVKGLPLVEESIADAAGGLDSLPEREFCVLLREHGLPPPTHQVPTAVAGRRYRLDAVFEPWGVSVEIDGAHHRDPLQSSADIRRQNDLVIAGRTVLRFSSYQVRHEPGHVAAVVHRALTAAGLS